MAAVLEVDYLCGWESGAVQEFNDGIVGSMSVVTPVPASPPVAVGNYCLYQNGADALTRFLVQGNTRLGRSMGFLWGPVTLPSNTDYCAQIAGFRGSTGLVGGGLGWRNDSKFCIYNLNGFGETVSPFTIGAYWYWLDFRLQVLNTSTGLCIAMARAHHYTGGAWVADGEWGLEAYFGAVDCNALSIGNLYSNNYSAWYLDNLYVGASGDWWVPTGINMAAHVPDGVTSGNNVNWLRGDTRVDDYPNEWPMVDEIPYNDADFVSRLLYLGAQPQYYSHAAGLVPAGQNVLAVASLFRGRNTVSSNHVYNPRIRLGANSVNRAVVANNLLSHYEDNIITARKDPTGAGWTIANVDAAEMGHDIVGGAASYKEVSQILLYAAWANDVIPAAIQRQAQVV